jgi:glycosyltransferase involved in cell wall biosynthesis
MALSILYDHQIFSMYKYGGISRYFYELISRIGSAPGVDVSLFLGLHISTYGIEHCQGRMAHFWGHRRPAIPKTNTLFTRFNNVLFSAVTRGWGSSLYHPTYYASLAHSFSGKRIITVHDMIHERYPSYFWWLDTSARDKKIAVSRADGIICVSHATKRDLLHYLPVNEQKVRVVYHANSLNSVVNGPPLNSRPYLLYVGQRHSYKNFLFFLAAYAHARWINECYDLVCFGGGSFSQEERHLIEKYHLTGKVKIQVGTDSTLANLYAHATAFVYPSLYEGFGIPPLEAMHYGCPVIASNSSSIPEVIGDAGLYFTPTDQEELIGQLDRLLTDHSLRDALKQKGYIRERQFTWDMAAAETLRFYSEIAAH